MTESSWWRERTLVALGRPPKRGSGSVDLLIQEVAVLFADRFSAADRQYAGDRPRWHVAVLTALEALLADGLVADRKTFALSGGGQEAVALARETLASRPDDEAPPPADSDAPTGERPLLTPGVIAPPLRDRAEREKMKFPTGDDEPMELMVELNLRYGAGVGEAFKQLTRLWVRVTGREEPEPLAGEYATGSMSMRELKRLVAADAALRQWPLRCIFRVWPDFPVKLHVDVSGVTIKADAARRSFNSYGDRIVWAVLDSGIDGNHGHFKSHHTLDHSSVAKLHRDFTVGRKGPHDGALRDELGHGTHVAGIIAGAIEPWLSSDEEEGRKVLAAENRFNVEDSYDPIRVPRAPDETPPFVGMAPKTKLVSLKVLQQGGGSLADRVSRIIAALAYVRGVNAQSDKLMRIHGVNLSVGYEFDAEWFACGQSPLCQEVDKLVRTGVVVVVAAGNSGYGAVNTHFDTPAKFGLSMTINDPGNAERAITVGSTHREMPHTYGVSYFSSKGPTGDGRRKPDLLAPGERITSCAAGAKRDAVLPKDAEPKTAVYVEESGTSMAAPHVSGAIAAFLSVRREFIGKPDRVKRIFVDSATPLGREPLFEGGGLLDLMRALQSV